MRPRSPDPGFVPPAPDEVVGREALTGNYAASGAILERLGVIAVPAVPLPAVGSRG